jgi:hypothetical protein
MKRELETHSNNSYLNNYPVKKSRIEIHYDTNAILIQKQVRGFLSRRSFLKRFKYYPGKKCIANRFTLTDKKSKKIEYNNLFVHHINNKYYLFDLSEWPSPPTTNPYTNTNLSPLEQKYASFAWYFRIDPGKETIPRAMLFSSIKGDVFAKFNELNQYPNIHSFDILTSFQLNSILNTIKIQRLFPIFECDHSRSSRIFNPNERYLAHQWEIMLGMLNYQGPSLSTVNDMNICNEGTALSILEHIRSQNLMADIMNIINEEEEIIDNSRNIYHDSNTDNEDYERNNDSGEDDSQSNVAQANVAQANVAQASTPSTNYQGIVFPLPTNNPYMYSQTYVNDPPNINTSIPLSTRPRLSLRFFFPDSPSTNTSQPNVSSTGITNNNEDTSPADETEGNVSDN